MKLSVIIPYYNGMKYIGRAIESCKGKDIEVIIVDDCSPEPFFCYPSNILVKVIHLDKNVGQGLARNAGIDAASGEWITFLDQDDEFLINLDTFMRLIPEESQAVWTQTIYKQMDGKTKVYDENLSLVHGKFYKRQWLIDHDIRFSEDCRWYEDIYFCNLLLPYLEADECARMDIPTYVWYQNPEQQTFTDDYNYEHFDCMIKANFEVFMRHYRRKLITKEQGEFCMKWFVAQGVDMLTKHKADKDYTENKCLLVNAIKKAAKAGLCFDFDLLKGLP